MGRSTWLTIKAMNGRARLGALLLTLLAIFSPGSAVAGQEGNLAALVLPAEALPGYQLDYAQADENFPREHTVVYSPANPEDGLARPFAIAVDLVLTGDRPTEGVANFIFARTVENFVDGFIRSAGANEAHFEAFDGPEIAPGTRWTRLDFEMGELPGSGFVVAFPWDEGMAFAMEIGFFDIATLDDAADLATAVAIRVGAITL